LFGSNIFLKEYFSFTDDWLNPVFWWCLTLTLGWSFNRWHRDQFWTYPVFFKYGCSKTQMIFTRFHRNPCQYWCFIFLQYLTTPPIFHYFPWIPKDTSERVNIYGYRGWIFPLRFFLLKTYQFDPFLVPYFFDVPMKFFLEVDRIMYREKFDSGKLIDDRRVNICKYELTFLSL